MAWFYLILVAFVFYAPVIGLSAKLMGSGIEIFDTGIQIPFSESFRPLIYSWLIWFLLWILTRWIESRTDFDVLYWTDQKWRGAHLRKRWMYAERPPISLRLAEYLADAGLAISLVKVVGVVLLVLILFFVLPWLVETVLPGLAASLVSNLAGVEWIEAFAGWLVKDLAEQLAGSVTMGTEELLRDLWYFDTPTSLLPLSVLTLSAVRAHRQERRARYWGDMERKQQEHKQAVASP